MQPETDQSHQTVDPMSPPATPRRRRLVLSLALVLALLVGVWFVAPWRHSAPAAGPARLDSPPVPADAVRPETFGARGDGVTDDTAALQRALDALGPGGTLALRDGATYRHTRVLRMSRPGTLEGSATLLATEEQNSAFVIDADDVRIFDVTFAVAATTRRWDSYDQMKVYVHGHHGLLLQSVQVSGSAAAGIYIGGGASGFHLDHVTVRDTRADGIHMTQGAHDGVLDSPTTSGTGDDGISVVSYEQDGSPCAHITVGHAHVFGAKARGVSVVGGSDVTWSDLQVSQSAAAAVYVAVEGAPYFTANVTDIHLLRAKISGANDDRSIDHGAVLLFEGRESRTISGVEMRDVDVTGTRASASRQVGIVTPDAKAVTGVSLDRFTLHGGPGVAFALQNPDQGYALRGWTQDGNALPDRQN